MDWWKAWNGAAGQSDRAGWPVGRGVVPAGRRGWTGDEDTLTFPRERYSNHRRSGSRVVPHLRGGLQFPYLNRLSDSRLDLRRMFLKTMDRPVWDDVDDWRRLSWPSLEVSLGLEARATPSSSSTSRTGAGYGDGSAASVGTLKYASTLAFIARFFSCAIMVMLVLLSLLDKLPRRVSRRVVVRVSDGVRESPPTAGARSLPTSRYSEVERFHPEQ